MLLPSKTLLLLRGAIPRRTALRAASTASVGDALTQLGLQSPAQSLIGGAWVAPAKSFDVLDPASGGLVAAAAACGAPEAEAAIAAAQDAFEGWAATTARQRATALRGWHDAIAAEAEALAVVATAECGKPLAESRAEVAYAASFVEWFAEEAPRVAGEVKANVAGDRRLLTVRQPVGVAAAITPWNFPLGMITRKIAPALAAGCPVVVKPSEETPLSALALAKLAEPHFPPGVVNVVAASREDAVAVGEALCDSPVVKALSFTGSTEVGKWLYARCAGTVKKLGLELGGNAPFLVLASADIDLAAKAAVASKFRNAGQTCVCADRFLVHEDVADAFCAALVRETEALGDPAPGLDAGTKLGPLITPAAVERVESRVNNAILRGADVLYAGGAPAAGNFAAATVVRGVPADAPVWRDENFGPVAAVRTFADDEDAIYEANDGPAGLAAYVCGELAHAWAVAEKLDYGIVGVNEAAVSHCAMPFGGTKESGLGREGGAHGIDEYLEDKYLCLGGLDMS